MTGMSLGSILSAGKLLVGGRETRGGLHAKAASAAGLLVVTSPAPTSASLNSKESPTAAAARTQSTLYENFSSEILKRLKDAAGDKKTGTGSLEGDPADPAALADSLAGAMGEIEEIFGREAATEAMAKILLGTENGAGRESVMASLETVLAGLGKLGRTGLEIRQLVEGFNRDLTLGEKELAEKIDSGATMSLSNALASFFGSQDSLTTGAGAGNGSLAAGENSTAAGAGTGESSLAQGDNSPGEGEKRADGGAVTSGAGPAAFADAAHRRSLTGGQSYLATAAAMMTVAEEYALDPSGPPGESPPGFADPSGDANGGASEKFTAMAFSLDGKWGRVEFEVRKAAPEDVRLAAEKGLETGVEVTLADLADKGSKAFADLLSFVKTNMNDDELEEYLAEKISQAEKYLEQEYGPNPKTGEVLAAVYAKTAEDGDLEKAALLENYLNTDFKKAVNPALSKMQEESAFGTAPKSLGDFQFQGVDGLSKALENGKFSLKWGYSADDRFSKTDVRDVSQEDLRAVRAVGETKDDAKIKALAGIVAETPGGKMVRESREAADRMRETGGNKLLETGRESGEKLRNIPDRAGRLTADFHAKRKEKHLAEFYGTKFGQLGGQLASDIKSYLADNFRREDADELMGSVRWNKSVMEGIAQLQAGIKKLNTGADAGENFIKFCNSRAMPEMNKVAQRLGGLGFDGWETPKDDSLASVTAKIHFPGEDEIKSSFFSKATEDEATAVLADLILDSAASERAGAKNKSRYAGTGFLINITV